MSAPAAKQSSSALTVERAAVTLGVTAAQLRQWIRDGAPVVRAGHRGRGHATLLDVGELTAWLRARDQAPVDESHRELARDLVADIAAVLIAGWRARSDPAKLRDAGAVVTQFALATRAIHERLGLPEHAPSEWPADIRKMFAALKHFRDFR